MAFRSPNAFPILLVLIITWFFQSSLVYAQDSQPWRSFRNNSANTGVTALTGPLFPDPQWTFNTSGYTYSSPAITESAVYIASEGELIALDLAGDELWSVSLNETGINIEGIEITGIVSSPAVANNGTIYVGSLDNHVYAISPGGAILWRFDTFDQVFGSPAIGPDGTIYVGSRSGGIFALNPNGTLRWSAFYSAEFFSSPALGPDGTLYIGGTDNILYALDTNNNGAFVWNSRSIIQEEIVSSPTVYNGVVYVGATDSRLYAFNAITGAPVWAQPFQASDVFVSSPAIGENNGTVYIGSFDGIFYAVNRANGTVRWAFDTGEILTSSAAVDGNGRIYITTLSGTLFVLQDSGNQANVLWTYAIGAPSWASPAIGPGNVLFIAGSGSQTTPGRLVAIAPSQYEIDFNPGIPIAGQDLNIDIRIAGTQTGANVTFFYRTAGTTNYNALPITGSGIISGVDINEAGLEYYVEGLQGTFPSNNSPSTQPATRQVFAQSIITGLDIFPRRYKMVSIPYELSDPAILSVLDEFGPYDPANWRLLQWNGTDYAEFPNFEDAFTPGNAFFLVTSNDTTFTIENATSVDTSQPYIIELAPGWNQVGIPYGFPVLWSNVVRNNTVVNSIAYYNGAEMIQDPTFLSTLFPWEGYFILNNSSEPTSIQIRPIPADQNTNAGKHEGENTPARLKITASIDDLNLYDSQNWIGIHPDASEGIDVLDITEAPPFGEHVRLSLGSPSMPLAVEYKPLLQQGLEWPMYLSASQDESLSSHTVTLSFERNVQFPSDFELALIDEDHGYARMITEGSTSIQWDPTREMRNLRLVTGTIDYINSKIQSIPLAPESYVLEQNFPNPFQQQTTIRYQLSERSNVSLVVYNALGQEIQTLVGSSQSPGSFEAIWDGKDARGHYVPSGIYFYRLQADEFQSTGRMTLIR